MPRHLHHPGSGSTWVTRRRVLQALAAGAPAPLIRFNEACAAARSGDATRAFGYLTMAVQAGFRNESLLASDADLATLRSDGRWGTITELVATNAHPCSDARHAEFDFWVGSWDVFLPGGRKAGTNRIEKILDGCVLVENWEGSLGGAGKSVNFVDPRSGKWRQVWNDSSGGVVEYAGELRDGAMRLEGEAAKRDGTVARGRVTFTPNPDGTVRQLIERSVDGGATWTVAFDGRYVKASP